MTMLVIEELIKIERNYIVYKSFDFMLFLQKHILHVEDQEEKKKEILHIPPAGSFVEISLLWEVCPRNSKRFCSNKDYITKQLYSFTA